MKKITLFILLCCVGLPLSATQNVLPKWLEKAKKAIITIAIYDADGQELRQGTGFYINDAGVAVSDFTLFKGAAKAIVKDIDGKRYEVKNILGANELYDVAKFQVVVPQKVSYLETATEPVAAGTEVYLLPYSEGKLVTNAKSGKILEVTQMPGSCHYYKVDLPLVKAYLSAPLLTPEGNVLGLAQVDAGGKNEVSYAMSAAYAKNMTIKSTDVFNETYSSIHIRKGWPQTEEDALVVLFINGNKENASSYLETLNDFIVTFPHSAEGYTNRASHYAYNRKLLSKNENEQQNYLKLAEEDIKQAEKYSKKKDETYYNIAKIIFGVVANDSTLQNKNWSIEKASDALRKAISENNLPIYHQLEGDIYMFQNQYDKAFNSYQIVNNSNLASPTSYYWAAQAKQHIEGTEIKEIIALLDSAVAKCETPLNQTAAPYIQERVDLKMQTGDFMDAVKDYNLYYDLMNGQVTDAFYYYREQAKLHSNDLKGALADIQEALRLNQENAVYYAEQATLLILSKDYAGAEASAKKALALQPDFAACYRLLGIACIRQDKKAEGCNALQKAKNVGDTIAEKLIQEYCK